MEAVKSNSKIQSPNTKIWTNYNHKKAMRGQNRAGSGKLNRQTDKDRDLNRQGVITNRAQVKSKKGRETYKGKKYKVRQDTG